jgi:hypothetical protein
MMTQSSGNIFWWIALLPGAITGLVMFFIMWISLRKRRWADWKRLSRPVTMPAEHIAHEPRTVRDMRVGEEAYVDSYAVVSSKTHRVFIRWDATLSEAPEDPNARFAPLRIRRLKRGFSITIRAGDEFRTSPVLWGSYAPVIEVVQAAPAPASETK